MPGLMALREEFGPTQPLKGARIMGSLHMTVQTAVLIETLVALGAQVRWVSCNIFSTQDDAAAAVAVGPTGTVDAPAGVPVFAWKGETLEEYWWCTEQAFDWSTEAAAAGADWIGPNMILDDGGDATLLVHKGREFELAGAVPADAAGDSHEWKVILDTLRRSLAAEPGPLDARSPPRSRASPRRPPRASTACTSSRRPARCSSRRSTSTTRSRSRSSTTSTASATRCPDGLNRATDVLMGGKVAFVAGYGDVGKGCAEALRGQGARVIVSEIDPICALQAAMDGYQVTTIENVLDQVDIFVTVDRATRTSSRSSTCSGMKHNAIVANVGHFDNEIDMAGLETLAGAEKIEIKPQVHEWKLPTGRSILVLSEGRLMNLGNATGHPSFVMSNSFTNQVLAQLELWVNNADGKYENQVYVLPKHLDEKVARLHLEALGVVLTELTPKQAAYIGVPVEGPYKVDHYRY